MNENFIVRACLEDGDVKGHERVTDSEHLDKCIERIKKDYDAPYAYVNKASMCFDGYFVNGDYVCRF